jgi:hypothetical protein
MPTGSVKILWDPSVAAYRVSTPYNPQFVELLKQLIPVADRIWDTQQKIWTIAEGFYQPVKDLCSKIWGQGSTTSVSRTEHEAFEAQQAAAQAQAQAQAAQGAYQRYVPPTRTKGEPLDIVLLQFAKVLPYEAARAAYRNAAMQLHPDKNGGDSTKMTALNVCWQRIEAEYYGKAKTA